MIAFDTNVLVRLLVKDDARQTADAVRIVDKLRATGDRAHISDVVVCEFVWVLRSAYKFSRAQIATAIRSLTMAEQLHFHSPEQILRALRAYEHGRGDFSDYLIREHALAASCTFVITFDRKLHAEDGFSAPIDAA